MQVWKFETARFTVALDITEDYGYRYDGADEADEIQAMLNDGTMVAFDSRVTVELDGVEIGSDSLGGSVYGCDETKDFWQAHRDPNPANRNCSLMRAARGDNVCICRYFPDMVRQAISEARKHLRNLPRIHATCRRETW